MIPNVSTKCSQFLRDMPYMPDCVYTQGITDLDKRCKKYYDQGARFAKWRAVFRIDEQHGYRIPQGLIDENAQTLAKYAAICQINGLVPIVEPELLFDGNYSLEVSKYWTEKIICACYKALSDCEVKLEATLLKPNMCVTGKQSKNQVSAKNEAYATLETLLRTVPAAVPGIMFLSGGQTMENATIRLNLINQMMQEREKKQGRYAPWVVSFSFARALQMGCLLTWKGDDKNAKAAQNEFIKRCQANSAAQLGQYKGDNNSSAVSG